MITANKRPVIVIGSLGGGREKYKDILYILYTRICVYYNNNVQYIGEPRCRCRGGGGLVIKRCIKIIKESFITPEHSWQWMRESTFIECVARNGRHQSQRARVYICYKIIICAPASAAAPFVYHYMSSSQPAIVADHHRETRPTVNMRFHRIIESYIHAFKPLRWESHREFHLKLFLTEWYVFLILATYINKITIIKPLKKKKNQTNVFPRPRLGKVSQSIYCSIGDAFWNRMGGGFTAFIFNTPLR